MIQLQALNKILSSRDISFITKNGLNEEYFSEYKNEFNFIENHIKQYNQLPDFETFLNKFPDFDVIKVNEDNSYLLNELIKDKNKRYLANSFNKVREYLLKDDTDGAIAYYSKINNNLSQSAYIRSNDIILNTERYNHYLEKTQDFSKFYVNTGFKELDNIIGGWDRQEELATIVARPGVGKSWVLLKSALASAQQGLNVGLYSGEMSLDLVGYRIDTLLGHISNGALLRGNEKVELEYKEYLEKTLPTIKGKLKVITPYDINGLAGVRALRTFIEQENLDILFIDQHSLLDDDNRAKTPVERASNISKDLKQLQVMKHIPIIAVSQQNRNKEENNTFSTSQVALSDRISQDSTIVLFLDRKESVLKIEVVKSRNSVVGDKLTYNVDLNKGEFTYIPEGNTPQAEELETRYATPTNNDFDIF